MKLMSKLILTVMSIISTVIVSPVNILYCIKYILCARATPAVVQALKRLANYRVSDDRYECRVISD